MRSIRLVEPTMSHKEAILDFKQAFPINISGIDGTSELVSSDSIEEWLNQLEKNRSWETVQKGWVPGIQYVAINQEGTIVGMLNLRQSLNEYLLNYGGHVGYAVRPDLRNQGLASEMVRQVLIKANKLGLRKTLITCTDDNSASIKVIEKNHGIMEDKRLEPQDGKLIRRYWLC